jgi:hypothetical protein
LNLLFEGKEGVHCVHSREPFSVFGFQFSVVDSSFLAKPQVNSV